MTRNRVLSTRRRRRGLLNRCARSISAGPGIVLIKLIVGDRRSRSIGWHHWHMVRVVEMIMLISGMLLDNSGKEFRTRGAVMILTTGRNHVVTTGG